MANKASIHIKTVAKSVTVKYVKKAKMWVVTFPKQSKTTQEWFMNEPTEQDLNNIKETMWVKHKKLY